MELTVIDVPERSRYEARDDAADGLAAGTAHYTLASGVMSLTHTEVRPDYEGQGVGSRLVRGVLDDARARGLRIVAICPFVKSWIQLHPGYADTLNAT